MSPSLPSATAPCATCPTSARSSSSSGSPTLPRIVHNPLIPAMRLRCDADACPFRVHVAYLHFGEKKTLIHAARYIDDVRRDGTRPGREPERVERDPRPDALHQDGGGHPRSD